MTPLYQGRALRREPHRVRRIGLPMRILRVLGVLALAAVLFHMPWSEWREHFAVVTQVDVRGASYLDPARVTHLAGVKIGDDLLNLDLDRARQKLLLSARIGEARVSRSGLRTLRITIAERRPVLLVRHGEPWEMDSTGVLLAPLGDGAVADVPLLSGADVASLPEGAQVRTPAVRRGLEWIGVLSASELQLAGRVSEIDVSEERSTALLMMNGTRVLTPAWPSDVRALSALRVVLADLEKRGVQAHEVDVRYQDQVIVRPAGPVATGDAGSSAS
jgi:POTRA domain, FtsQ-type/Cell division protein FtsQ